MLPRSSYERVRCRHACTHAAGGKARGVGPATPFGGSTCKVCLHQSQLLAARQLRSACLCRAPCFVADLCPSTPASARPCRGGRPGGPGQGAVQHAAGPYGRARPAGLRRPLGRRHPGHPGLPTPKGTERQCGQRHGGRRCAAADRGRCIMQFARGVSWPGHRYGRTGHLVLASIPMRAAAGDARTCLPIRAMRVATGTACSTASALAMHAPRVFWGRRAGTTTCMPSAAHAPCCGVPPCR